MVIHQLHGCDSSYLESAPVHERFQGRTVWQGVVEVFQLRQHPQAQRCYAWSYQAEDGHEEMVTVLEVIPVTSAQTAVRAAIVRQAKGR